MNSVRVWVEPGERIADVGTVDVGDEVQREPRMREGAKRRRYHRRPEIGAADANVHDIGERHAGAACDPSVAQPLGEVRAGRPHRANVRHNVVAVDQHRVPREVAQRRVQNRPVLGRVDRRACEHRIASLLPRRRSRQVGEQRQRVAGDAVLRVIEQDLATTR